MCFRWLSNESNVTDPEQGRNASGENKNHWNKGCLTVVKMLKTKLKTVLKAKSTHV